MNRADFWCRVLGWLQIAGAAVVGAAIYILWELIVGWIELDSGGFFTLVKWLIIVFFVGPPFLSGLLTVLFANTVEQAREGLRGNSHWLLRLFAALAGLWSAGAIGFAGVNVPALGVFAVMGLITALIAIMGHEWTADLLQSNEEPT
jgi:hypothetical protein